MHGAHAAVLAVRGGALVRLPAEDQAACRQTWNATFLIAACARNTRATSRNDLHKAIRQAVADETPGRPAEATADSYNANAGFHSISKLFVNAKAKRRQYRRTASDADKVHG